MPDMSRPETLTAIADWLPGALSRGAADPRSAFHWPTLGTVGLDGAPAMRTVVLREHQPDDRALVIYTDARSAKIAELEANPRASVHFYDPKKKVQLRLSGLIEVHREGAVQEAAWSRVQTKGSSDFAHQPGPGTEIETHDAYLKDGTSPKEQLAVLRFIYQSADYLHLGREAHRRARIAFSGEEPRRTWLVP